MTELLENLIQLAVTGICTGAAIHRAVSYREKIWADLALFYGLFFLGDLYWILYLLFYGDTPQYGYISDLAWYAAFVFLILLIQQVSGLKPDLKTVVPWIGPLFALGMGIFYMQWGDIFGNILSMLIMGTLLWLVLYHLFPGKRRGSVPGKNKSLYVMILIICLLEYILWTLSCFWMGETLANPYFWADFALTAVLPLLLMGVRKAVET